VKVLEMVRALRRDSQIPVVLYIYFNLIHRYGMEKFIRDAAQAGVDGLLVLDLPPDESGSYETWMREANLSVIYLVAPTTPDDRIELIVKRGSGFVYYVSREGVTGMQQTIASNLSLMISKIRQHTNLPIAVGFGISNADQARLVAATCDAIVVGSAVVDQIGRHGKSADLIERVGQFVQPLIKAVKQ
jgi:tryptophan synthase alpha chain